MLRQSAAAMPMPLLIFASRTPFFTTAAPLRTPDSAADARHYAQWCHVQPMPLMPDNMMPRFSLLVCLPFR